MKDLRLALVIFALSAVSLPFGQAQSSNRIAAEDEDVGFIRGALTSGWHDVQLGRIALQQSADTQVKNLAQRIIDDQVAANEHLTHIAGSTWREDLPSEPAAPRKDMRTNSYVVGGDTPLASLQGWRFDRAYVHETVESQSATIAKYQAAQDRIKNPELRKLIESEIPKLREHLKQAEALSK
jgi:putative membrane protein